MSSGLTDSTGFYEFLAWMEENKKRLVLVAAGLVVAGFGFAVYRWKREQTEIAASEALLELRTPMNAPEKTPPPAASGYLKMASAYPNTSAAQRARLLAAGALFTEGKYGDARAEFDRFLQQYGEHPLAAIAACGRAASLDAEGKQDEALRAYQEVMARYPKASLVDDVKLAMARLYEIKKQPQLALQAYEEITRTNLMSARSSEANTRKEHLLARYPELAKTHAPAAPMTNIVQAPAPKVSNVNTNAATNAAAISVTNSTQGSRTNAPLGSTNPPANVAEPKK